jgi:VIT family
VPLDRILGREKWHRTGASWISGAIYGANDGLAAVFGIVGGVSGAAGGSNAVLTAGISTGIGAIIPVIPFVINTGTPATIAAAVVSLLAHFLVGAAKSLVTLRSWWSAGLEMTLAGAIVGGALYVIGLALPT